jgi:hypothetical protein
MLNPPISVDVQADSVTPNDDLNHARMYKSSHMFFNPCSLIIFFCRDSLPLPTDPPTSKPAANFKPLTSNSKPSTQSSQQLDDILHSKEEATTNQELVFNLSNLNVS